jgi:tetratricopeptide (TPR) repeat protein
MKFILILCTCLFLFSCETTTKPIIYDKNIDVISQESQLIHQLLLNENYIDAENQIEKDLKLYPENIEILSLKAWLFLYTGKYDQSRELFLKVLEKNKSNPMAYLGLTRIYKLTDQKEKAKESVKYGLSYTKLNSNLWLEKGIIEYEENSYKQALVDFTKSYNLDLKNNDAAFFKYITMLKLGRELDEIKSIWENILKSQRFKSYYFLYHAGYLYEAGKKDMALTILKSGLGYFPKDPYLLNFYAYFLYEKYKIDYNEETLKDADININKCFDNSSKIEPEFIDTYFYILQAKKENEKLKSELDKYILMFPDSQLLMEWVKKIKG